MTAIEYLKAKSRMTNKCGIVSCPTCPLGKSNNGEGGSCRNLEGGYPAKAVEIVEKWAKEHPIKTRQSEFLKMFPDSLTDKNGIIDICPMNVNRKHTCNGLIGCDTCCKKFWSEEIV